MTSGQRRHHAARPQGTRYSVGLPRPGQVLLGLREPEPSLFGVPQQRSPQEDPPPAQRRQPSWPVVLGLPLAVITLGVALGVIAVVTLVAAGVPEPW